MRRGLPEPRALTWPGERVRKKDITVAKNYLTESEITQLNRLTTMFLDFAELRAKRRQQTLMADWVDQTERFLAFNEQDVLRGAGSISAEAMQTVTAERYAEFDERRRGLEAERAMLDEADDLRRLTALEQQGELSNGLDEEQR
jgi:hypothetical protein